MPDAAEWVPIRRPPAWTNSTLLGLLRGTPVNCLIDGKGTLLPGLETPNVAFVERSKLSHNTASPVVAVTGNVWPGVKLSRDPKAGENEDRAEAGPTGVPWVESNGWFVRLARTLIPGKPVWIAQDPPNDRPVSAESYMLAIADAAAYGGRWVVSLDDRLSEGLAARASSANATWQRIVAALAFFEAHRVWRTFTPEGALAVLSDFAGPNEFLATEVLNLLPRRHLPFLILNKTKAGPPAFAGLKTILYPDQDPPGAELRQALMGFAETGGTVISPVPSAALANGLNESSERYHRYRIYTSGKGRIAVAREEEADPYVVAADAHTLLSRAHDLLRVWNGGPTNTYYTASPEERTAVVHVLSYIRRPVREVSLRVRRPYRSARLWTLESSKPQTLRSFSDAHGIEIHLPPISVYAAVELKV